MKLTNQEQLKHLPHVEDLVFIYGNDGLVYIDKLFSDILKGSAEIKVKMDGSPSIVCGWRDNKFFVATKSLFNKKTPKINFTDDDIKTNHADKPELQSKLSFCLQYLKDVVPNSGIEFQGDLMFTDDVKNISIWGSTYSVFKPNTIVYGINSVPAMHSNAPEILKFKMGIVFHTSYTNNTVDYNPDLSILKNTKDVFIIKNDLHDYKLKDITRNIIKNTMDKWLHGNNTDFSSITKNSEIFLKFINKRIKESKDIKNPTQLMEDFSKENTNVDKSLLQKVFACFCKIAECKQHLIDDFNTVDLGFKEFYYKNGEYTETNPEGYVVIIDNGITKLVNRESFSKENFNQEKDWN